MSAIPDPVDAIVALLRADPALAGLIGGRVFNTELPESETGAMPRGAIVVAPSGGGLIGRAYQQYGDVRLDVRCYGETPKAARDVWRSVQPALKGLRREVRLGCLMHWARQGGGPLSGRDPDTDWPSIWSSWQVLVAEVAVA